MNLERLTALTKLPSVVIASLLLLAVVAFAAVNRLVNRFSEQELALARHLHERGQQEQRLGHPARALEDFRAALSYDRGNFQYRLSLARALRDSGRTDESETYLNSLWEEQPQDGAVNLALARLYAREKSIDNAIRYYHNAIYGVWTSDAESRRLSAHLELTQFLLQQNATQQAEAELITLALHLPRDPSVLLQVAGDFMRTRDYEQALFHYQETLHLAHDDEAALSGAGQAAFQLGRYRLAYDELSAAVRHNPEDADAKQALQLDEFVLRSDPFERGISGAERDRRVRTAFEAAGKRLDSCTPPEGSAATSPAPLESLRAQWRAMKARLGRLRGRNAESPEAIMDLVFQIEQQATQSGQICSAASDIDRALVLLAQSRGDEGMRDQNQGDAHAGAAQ